MFDFERPNIEVAEISEDKKYGRFVVEPLERGYGITLGNSLRRIMLSSLPGAAVSQVKIEGVLHEFSSIPGVKEDVTEIIMNIKSLAIKNNSETNEPKTAYIEFEGEGVVRASDIQADQDMKSSIRSRNRHAERRQGKQAVHGADHYQGTRLCQRREEQERGSADRCDRSGFHLHPC